MKSQARIILKIYACAATLALGVLGAGSMIPGDAMALNAEEVFRGAARYTVKSVLG